MQLFITPVEIQGDYCSVREERVIFQCTKVLRYHIGSELYVQDGTQRICGEIMKLSKLSLELKIISREEVLVPMQGVELCVALPNKQEKLELIVQKLTELGVQTITLRPSQRSQIHDISPKKLERLQTIMLESAEQAWLPSIPTLKIYSRKEWILCYQDRTMLVFDIAAGGPKSNFFEQILTGLVGPEGGFGPEDYHDFGKNIMIQSLGTSVLRMETAAIVAARGLQQGLFPKHLP